MKRFTAESYIGKSGISASKKIITGYSGTHYHEFFELEYFCGGEGSYILDGTEYPISDGMFFLMTPINFHSVKVVNATVFNVMFSEKVCNTELLARCVESRRGLAFSVKKEDRPFFASVLKEICQNAENSLYTANLINSLLFKSLQYKSKNDATPTSISRAVIHLLRHFREKPSLSNIAAIAGYTPSYFSAIFKKEVGEGFKEYLDRLRFDYAYKLLEHTELNVIQVCKESGFDDYPNFVRRFSKRFSVSPKKVTKCRVK